jgi:hypothetical protein
MRRRCKSEVSVRATCSLMQFMEGFLEELVSELTLKAREPLSGKEM